MTSDEPQTFVTRPRYASAMAVPIPPSFTDRGGDEKFDHNDPEYRDRLKVVAKWCKATIIPPSMMGADSAVMHLPLGPERKRGAVTPGQVILLDQRTEAYFSMDMDQFVATFEVYNLPDQIDTEAEALAAEESAKAPSPCGCQGDEPCADDDIPENVPGVDWPEDEGDDR